MPSLQPHINGVNFLVNQLEPKSRWDKIYDWVVNTAKYIIILIEIMIIVAFVIRFKLDDTNNTLIKQIENVKRDLNNTKPNEKRIVNLARSLQEIQTQFYNNEDPFLENYQAVLQLIPAGVTIENLTIDVKSCNLQGTANNLTTMDQLESNFLHSDVIVLESSRNIDGQTNGSVGFNFTFYLSAYSKKK